MAASIADLRARGGVPEVGEEFDAVGDIHARLACAKQAKKEGNGRASVRLIIQRGGGGDVLNWAFDNEHHGFRATADLRMQPIDIEQLAALIGEEILARRARRPAAPARRGPIDEKVAALIDHTILKPEATAKDVKRVCAEALQYKFAAVCVNPCWVTLAAAELKGSTVKCCTVAGFPLGASATEIKAAEVELAVRTGAQEVDMVMNVGALRGGDYERVRTDIAAVVQACHRGGAIVKVILENALLDDSQKAIACALAKSAGADFVKTSTGFAATGATAEDVALMRRIVGNKMGVKAAGGVRTLEDLRRMVAAGACRVGASASVSIVEATAGGG